MRSVFNIAWERFTIISSVVSDASARLVSLVFYFTILVPFGIASRIFSDPLHKNDNPGWLNRDPVPNDVDSARQQG